jgi:hypothetical protein
VTRQERLEARILKYLADDRDWPHATRIWLGVGGRTGILGLIAGPGFTRVLEALHRLSIDGKVVERRRTPDDSRPRRHYALRIVLAEPAKA